MLDSWHLLYELQNGGGGHISLSNVLEYHRAEPSFFVENKCYCGVALKVRLHRQFHTDVECENSCVVRGSA